MTSKLPFLHLAYDHEHPILSIVFKHHSTYRLTSEPLPASCKAVRVYSSPGVRSVDAESQASTTFKYWIIKRDGHNESSIERFFRLHSTCRSFGWCSLIQVLGKYYSPLTKMEYSGISTRSFRLIGSLDFTGFMSDDLEAVLGMIKGRQGSRAFPHLEALRVGSYQALELLLSTFELTKLFRVEIDRLTKLSVLDKLPPSVTHLKVLHFGPVRSEDRCTRRIETVIMDEYYSYCLPFERLASVCQSLVLVSELRNRSDPLQNEATVAINLHNSTSATKIVYMQREGFVCNCSENLKFKFDLERAEEESS